MWLITFSLKKAVNSHGTNTIEEKKIYMKTAPAVTPKQNLTKTSVHTN